MILVVRNTCSITSCTAWARSARIERGRLCLTVVGSLGALTGLVLASWAVVTNGTLVEVGG